jgi:hypothetical protein
MAAVATAVVVMVADITVAATAVVITVADISVAAAIVAGISPVVDATPSTA